MMTKRTAFVTAGFAAVFYAAQAAYGQGCIGVPIPQGSYGGQFEVGFGDEATTYGGLVTANLAGPFSVGAGYGLRTAAGTSNIHNLSGNVAFELPRLPLSLCLLAGFRHLIVSSGNEPGSNRSITLPVGIALVHPFPLSLKVTVTPYLTPQFLLRYSDTETTEDSRGDTDSGFEFRKGIVVGIQRFFIGADAELYSSLEGSTPTYRISMGARF